jgi:NhaP-type Na+/H+ or K+/H+ antiporter
VAWVATQASDREDIGEDFFFASSIGLALFTMGSVHLLGASGILASFVAGVTFSLRVSDEQAAKLERVQSGVERSLLAAVFLLFVAMLPWDGWAALGWSGVAFAAWVLVLRRPPVVPLALLPTRTPGQGVAFLAWFGPVGVAAIYYSLFVERYRLDEYERLFAAATLVIAVSVVVHTLTAALGVRAYAASAADRPRRSPAP